MVWFNEWRLMTSAPTGVDFYSKALYVDDKVVSLQLWDTAGQERFQSVTKAYYRGAQGVVLMYDISQEESFIAVKSWINSIQVRGLYRCVCALHLGVTFEVLSCAGGG